MSGSPKYRPSQLPRRLPVGATYVVEGFGGAEGDLRVIARYVVLPGGQRINVPTDLSNAAARRPRSSSQHA
jgi:Mn-containing catalase